MAKIITDGYKIEKEIVCKKCESTIAYTTADIEKKRGGSGRRGTWYKYVVECLRCGYGINVKNQSW